MWYCISWRNGLSRHECKQGLQNLARWLFPYWAPITGCLAQSYHGFQMPRALSSIEMISWLSRYLAPTRWRWTSLGRQCLKWLHGSRLSSSITYSVFTFDYLIYQCHVPYFYVGYSYSRSLAYEPSLRHTIQIACHTRVRLGRMWSEERDRVAGIPLSVKHRPDTRSAKKKKKSSQHFRPSTSQHATSNIFNACQSWSLNTLDICISDDFLAMIDAPKTAALATMKSI